ncbi:MAG: iron-sulfur cluster assembly scaffold protein, partial [Candidatus Bilamarchaeaceae archaeon]
HFGSASNRICGDNIKIELKVEEGKIKKAGFTGVGCALSIAGASLLTEKLKGMELDKAAKIDDDAMLALFGLGPDIKGNRKRCALLSLVALRKALGI